MSFTIHIAFSGRSSESLTAESRRKLLGVVKRQLGQRRRHAPPASTSSEQLNGTSSKRRRLERALESTRAEHADLAANRAARRRGDQSPTARSAPRATGGEGAKFKLLYVYVKSCWCDLGGLLPP